MLEYCARLLLVDLGVLGKSKINLTSLNSAYLYLNCTQAFKIETIQRKLNTLKSDGSYQRVQSYYF